MGEEFDLPTICKIAAHKNLINRKLLPPLTICPIEYFGRLPAKRILY